MIAALVVAVHLGVGGDALAASRWTGWAADVVLAVVVVKLIVIAGHIVLGCLAIRRRNASKAR